MTVSEVIRNKPNTVKYEFFFEDGEVVHTSQINHILKYPVIELPRGAWDRDRQFKVLVTKEAETHARVVRKVSCCMDCLRFPWCEDLSQQLRDEVNKAKEKKECKK